MRQPLLDCNLEDARFYRLRPLQRFRIKRWDYYAVFTPQRFFSATIADLGYAGNIFVYTLDFASGELHEEGLVIPLGQGISLPRNSTGRAKAASKTQRRACVFGVDARGAHGFGRLAGLPRRAGHPGRDSPGLPAGARIDDHRHPHRREALLLQPQDQLHAGRGIDHVRRADAKSCDPPTCLGSLDWGRGVWEYRSFWNWASASGFLPDGRTHRAEPGLRLWRPVLARRRTA